MTIPSSPKKDPNLVETRAHVYVYLDNCKEHQVEHTWYKSVLHKEKPTHSFGTETKHKDDAFSARHSGMCL